MAVDKKAYDAEYNRRFTVLKHVTFNTKKEEDMEVMHFLESKPSMSAYIKALIVADMMREQNV